MKFLIVCLFAAASAAPEAEAEADPALLYGGYGYPYAYGGYGLTHTLGYAGLPVAHTVVKTVAADAEEPAVAEVKTVAAPLPIPMLPILMLPMPTMLDTHMPMLPTTMLHMLLILLMARGLLMLSPRLMLLPTTDTTDMPVDMDLDIVDMDMPVDMLDTVDMPDTPDTPMEPTDMLMAVKKPMTNKRNHS
eukprot:TRINITY_DN14582_c0_g1_i2.p1 TRINITY_DN14582_c0_g1~~TRINITY_DN14582_c0_g1_i2.p1  ORF type:complete len:190 (-),score=34.08 TRINITY_DN14582_c0_g1_i2:424-993(-)